MLRQQRTIDKCLYVWTCWFLPPNYTLVPSLAFFKMHRGVSSDDRWLVAERHVTDATMNSLLVARTQKT